MDHSQKHDIENAALIIARLSRLLQPLVQKLVAHARQTNAVGIATEEQYQVIETSMETLKGEANRLTAMVDVLFATK